MNRTWDTLKFVCFSFCYFFGPAKISSYAKYFQTHTFASIIGVQFEQKSTGLAKVILNIFRSSRPKIKQNKQKKQDIGTAEWYMKIYKENISLVNRQENNLIVLTFHSLIFFKNK